MDKLAIVRSRLAKLDKPRFEDGTYVTEWWVVGSPVRGKRFQLQATLFDPSKARTWTKKVSFGAPGADTFIDHGDEVRRANFHSRFAKTIAATKSNPFAPMTLSAKLLW